MNLCEVLSNELIDSQSKFEESIYTICKSVYLAVEKKATNNARVGLTRAYIEVSNDDIDKLDALDNDQKTAYIFQIRKELSEMINPKVGKMFEFYFTNVVLKKKKSKKRSRVYVNISWLRNKKRIEVPKSNVEIQCRICMEKKIGMSLQCGHLFCTSCSKKLLSKPCPICRRMCTLVHPLYES